MESLQTVYTQTCSSGGKSAHLINARFGGSSPPRSTAASLIGKNTPSETPGVNNTNVKAANEDVGSTPALQIYRCNMEITITDAQPTRQYKAQADCARCMVCTIKFHSDDLRENVYKDDRLVGVIHEQCYPLLWTTPE